MMDKLFDGSDAHLLPSNAELIQRLLSYTTPAIYWQDAKAMREAADALEAADKRIAELEAELADRMSPGMVLTLKATIREAERKLDEAHKRIAKLEAAIIGWKADQKENMATAVEECKRANEAERKLAVAREAMTKASALECNGVIRVALAQIGGDDAGS